MTTEQIIDDIIRREGRHYTNDPADRGGPTKFGITHVTLAEWRGRPVTPQDVAQLEEPEARDIYRKRYVDAPGFSQVSDDRLRALLVDVAVLHGPGRSVRWLQTALGVPVDGALGPKTLAAIAAADSAVLYAAIVAVRVNSLIDLALSDRETKQFLSTHQHVQLRFLRGWVRRAVEFLS